MQAYRADFDMRLEILMGLKMCSRVACWYKNLSQMSFYWAEHLSSLSSLVSFTAMKASISRPINHHGEATLVFHSNIYIYIDDVVGVAFVFG